MSFLADLVRRGNPENPNTRLTGQELLSIYQQELVTQAGISVSPETAVRHTAVFRAWSLIAGTSAALPLHVFTRGKSRTDVTERFPFIRDPNEDLTDFEFFEIAYTHLLGWGNFYGEKRRNQAGEIIELWPIMSRRVRVGRVAGVKTFFIKDDNGQEIPLTSDTIFHIPGLGYDGLVGLSPIAMAREAIAAGLSAEKYANKLWSSGALVGGLIETDARLEPSEAEELKRRWNEKVSGVDRAHEIAVLDAGAKWHQLSIPPQDAQFIETRRFQVAEVARLYGLPLHLLSETDRSTSWGSGIEMMTQSLVTFTLTPGYLRRVERRITKDLLPKGVFAEYGVQGLLRGDNKTRSEFYEKMHGIVDENGRPAMTVDEIRELENLPPLPPAAANTNDKTDETPVAEGAEE